MTHVIETDGLTKYYGTARGIEDLDLEVESGEIFGFIGPNGAGKTTTIRTLLDLIFPTGGHARIFGLDTHTESKEIKQSVGYLPSDDYFYSGMTGGELLEYSVRIKRLDRRESRTRIDGLAERLDLDLDGKIKSLSRGNRRKVSIVKALLGDPKVLILDEPTSGLDPLMQNRFFEIIEEEREKGTTVFFSSHILSEVQRICTRVAIIKNGRIVRTERVESLAREHRRKVTLELKPGASLDALDADGIEEVERNGDIIRFLYRGDPDGLLAFVGSAPVRTRLADVSIERSSLDEIFLGFYRESAEEEVR